MLLHENEVLNNFLNIENLKIIQRNDYFNFSLDTVLLANFITINRTTKKILDLGTGNAAIPLLVSTRSNAKITGVEIQDISADLAIRNVKLNNLENRISIIHEDMKNLENILNDDLFDVVLSNPPFFKLDNNINQLNDLEQLSKARHEFSITLEEIVNVGSKFLKNRGYFAMVHRADRLSEILEVFKKYKIGVKRIQFCHANTEKRAKIVLIEGLKNSDSSLNILPPLFTNKKDGSYTDTILDMFKGSYKY